MREPKIKPIVPPIKMAATFMNVPVMFYPLYIKYLS
jgi:hypothetical protein